MVKWLPGSNNLQSDSSRVVPQWRTCNFHRPAIVHHAITGVQSSVNESMTVEVVHSVSDVSGKREPEGPRERDIIIQEDVRQRPLWTVLHQDTNIGGLCTGSHKLTQVWVPQLSAAMEEKDFNSFLDAFMVENPHSVSHTITKRLPTHWILFFSLFNTWIYYKFHSLNKNWKPHSFWILVKTKIM